jgi:hypothetical protein
LLKVALLSLTNLSRTLVENITVDDKKTWESSQKVGSKEPNKSDKVHHPPQPNRKRTTIYDDDVCHRGIRLYQGAKIDHVVVIENSNGSSSKVDDATKPENGRIVSQSVSLASTN